MSDRLDLLARPKVVVDSSTLWSSTRRDFVLSFAEAGGFEPFWSSGVAGETQHEERKRLIGCGDPPAEADRRARQVVRHMRNAFPSAEVGFERNMGRTTVQSPIGWSFEVDPLVLIDPHDVHVIAAAIAVGADAILTENTSHFELHRLPSDTRVLGGAGFAEWAARTRPERFIDAIDQVVGHTDMSVAELLDKLERTYRWDEAVERIRPRLGPPRQANLSRPLSERIHYEPGRSGARRVPGGRDGVER